MEVQLQKLEAAAETLGVRVLDGASNDARDIAKEKAGSQAWRYSTGKRKSATSKTDDDGDSSSFWPKAKYLQR